MNNKKKLTFNTYKLISSDNKEYMYVSKTGAIYEIDATLKKVLNFEGITYDKVLEYFSKENLTAEFEEILKLFEEHSIIRGNLDYTLDKIKELKKTSFENISAITLMVAQDCNLRCLYCYGDEGQYHEKGFMTFDIAKKSIDFLMKNSISKRVTVAFFGGEPLINFKLVKQVVAYCKNIECKYDKKTNFAMTTNCTLITKDISTFLKENHFGITVSIDGDESIHNTHRIYCNNKGSYKDVINGINILNENNISITARATASPFNIDINKTITHLNSLNFKSIEFSEALNLFKTKSDFDKLEKEYSKMVKQYRGYILNNEYSKVKSNYTVMNILKDFHELQKRETFCAALINTITIDTRGYIYPCHRFVSNKDYRLGNIKSGINQEIYSNMFKCEFKTSSRKVCSNCWAYNLCNGCCPNDNLSKTGSCNEPFEDKCRIFKKLAEDLLKLYVVLSDEDKIQLNL